MKNSKYIDFSINFKGNQNDTAVNKIILDLMKVSIHFEYCKPPQVPWFPIKLTDLDAIGKKTLSEGDGIEMTDHPGFNDIEYKNRR